MSALVQVTKSTDTNDGASTTVATAAFGTNTTAGNCITGHVTWQGAAADLTGISGQGTGTVLDATKIDTANSICMASYVVQNIVGGTTTPITASFSASDSFRRISAQEFSGEATTGQPNKHELNFSATFGTGADAVTSAVSGGQTTTATCTLVGFAYDDSTPTIPSVGTGFTNADSATFGAGDAFRVEYKLAETAGAGKKATFTTTAGTDTIGVGFIAIQETSGGTGPSLMGAGIWMTA